MPTIDSIKINNTIYDLRDNSINDSFGDIILPIQNLYNSENVISGAYIKSTGDMILSNEYSYYTDFIPVLPNTTYTASTGLQVYCSEYSSNNLSSVITDSASTQRRSLDVKGTFTTTSNTHYVCFTAFQRPFPSNFTFVLGNKLPYNTEYNKILNEQVIQGQLVKITIDYYNANKLTIETGKGKHILEYQSRKNYFLTDDTVFDGNKAYYKRNVSGSYSRATDIVAGNTIAANTYYEVLEVAKTWRLTAAYANNYQLWNDVDVECPILLMRDDSLSGAGDHIGGYHNDEFLVSNDEYSVVMLKDGEPFVPSFEVQDRGNEYYCKNFTISIKSELNSDTGNYFNNGSPLLVHTMSEAATLLATKKLSRVKQLVFQNNKVQIFNTFKNITNSDIQVRQAYIGLYPIPWYKQGTEELLFNGVTNNVLNVYTPITNSNSAILHKDVTRISFYGDDITINFKALCGENDKFLYRNMLTNMYYGNITYEANYHRNKVYFYYLYPGSDTSNLVTMTLAPNQYFRVGYEIEFV